MERKSYDAGCKGQCGRFHRDSVNDKYFLIPINIYVWYKDKNPEE